MYSSFSQKKTCIRHFTNNLPLYTVFATAWLCFPQNIQTFIQENSIAPQIIVRNGSKLEGISKVKDEEKKT